MYAIQGCVALSQIFKGYPINPFPNKPWFLRVWSTSLLKTLWEEEKWLVTSNFSFSHIFFYPFGELLSANSFSMQESNICRLGKG